MTPFNTRHLLAKHGPHRPALAAAWLAVTLACSPTPQDAQDAVFYANGPLPGWLDAGPQAAKETASAPAEVATASPDSAAATEAETAAADASDSAADPGSAIPDVAQVEAGVSDLGAASPDAEVMAPAPDVATPSPDGDAPSPDSDAPSPDGAAEVDAVIVKPCPVAKFMVLEGQEVVPQTKLHLWGSQSTAAGGATVSKYQWTVKQPAGSNQPLLPNATFANPTLQANVAGEYEFCLQVWDSSGVQSCAPACAVVLAIPSDAIHIELLWDTPADPDQTDSGPAAGADFDLHFGHPLAQGADLDCDGKPDPWFSNPWDCFWFNGQPQWGSANTYKDDPTLDLDDTDGAGPENLNLPVPEGTSDAPVPYSVGVHYWNDHGYGTSFASVAIYIQGGLAVQHSKVKMDPLDMWYVGKLWWPNVASGGAKKVFETCYQSGFSCPAKKNLMWQPKGDWCLTKCYNNKAFVGTVGGGAAASNCKP